MASFIEFSDILPDPNNLISSAGAPDTGSAGPGYLGVKLSSNEKIMSNRTNSGSVSSRGIAAQYWTIDLSYNPMSRDLFDIVASFLLGRRNGLIPFYVSLPQYVAPKDSTFATYVASSTVSTVDSSGLAGISSLRITVPSSSGSPSIGDIFNIYDALDSTHTKAYKVLRVETNADYKIGTTQPTVDQRRIHFTPPLSKSFSSIVELTFDDPKFRVVLKQDTQEYSLNVDSLYSFSLKLEEAQV